MAKPKNLNAITHQLLDLMEDMKDGNVRVADAKERINAFGKATNMIKLQLEANVINDKRPNVKMPEWLQD
jgi:hypothetical protein